MASIPKYWHLNALVPDRVAHEVMTAIAVAKGLVERFEPAATGPVAENGKPTSRVTPAEFVAAYIAEHPRFKTKELSRAAVDAGLAKSSVNANVYALKGKGELVHVGPGEFAVKGMKISKRTAPLKRGRPVKAKEANGTKQPGKRIAPGVAENAVVTRVNRANGAAVGVAALRDAVTEAGGAAKSVSGVIARLIKSKRLKHAEEKGHYVGM